MGEVQKHLWCFDQPWPVSRNSKEQIQNIYGAMMQSWNNSLEIKTRKQYLLDLEHSETAKHTAK